MRRSMTREQIERRYADGYGQGEGESYKPWLDAHDVPSTGITTRLPGRKVPRMHVTFSKIERHALLAVQRLDVVVDIREQFPLWPLSETEEIAAALEVNHPTDLRGGIALMTTDLLLSTRDGKFEAIAVKPRSKLHEPRLLEKLEIERIYWERRDVSWSLVTDVDLPADVVWNLEWLDEYFELSPEAVPAEDIPRLEAHLFQCLTISEQRPLNRVCSDEDNRLGRRPGTCLAVVRHALARKRWFVPLDRRLDPDLPLPPPILTGAQQLLAS